MSTSTLSAPKSWYQRHLYRRLKLKTASEQTAQACSPSLSLFASMLRTIPFCASIQTSMNRGKICIHDPVLIFSGRDFCSECVKVRSINFATAKVLQIFRNTLEQGGDKKKPDTNKGSIKSQRNLIQQRIQEMAQHNWTILNFSFFLTLFSAHDLQMINIDNRMDN